MCFMFTTVLGVADKVVPLCLVAELREVPLRERLGVCELTPLHRVGPSLHSMAGPSPIPSMLDTTQHSRSLLAQHGGPLLDF